MAGAHAGVSLIEMLWEQADAQYAKLCKLHDESGGWKAEDLPATDSSDCVQAAEYLQAQGKVQALAFAVGTVLFPYDTPKERIDKVRPMLAERWEADNPDEEEDEDE